MTMTSRTKAVLAVVVTAIAALLLGGCSQNLDWQCGTIGRPPINVAASLCERGTPGVKWYSANVNDLEDDDISVIGLPLDDDYYPGDTRKYKPVKSTRTVVKTVTKSATPTPTTKSTSKSTPTAKSTATRTK